MSVAGGNMSSGLMFSHGWEPQSVAGLSVCRVYGQTMCPIVTHDAIDRSACHVYLFHVRRPCVCVSGGVFWKTASGLQDSKNHQRQRSK